MILSARMVFDWPLNGARRPGRVSDAVEYFAGEHRSFRSRFGSGKNTDLGSAFTYNTEFIYCYLASPVATVE